MSADKWLLGLCTGNHCAGDEYGRDRGNGRIVVSRMKEEGSRCAWVPQKVISIPATAAFSQFSGIAIRRNKILIASQVRVLRLPEQNDWLLLGNTFAAAHAGP